MPGNEIHYGINGMRRPGDQKQKQNQAPKQALIDLGKEMYPDKRPNQDRRQHFGKVRDEVATNQTFGQQKSQRADLQHHNEHLHGASLFLLAVPRQRAPDCRKRSRKSDRSRRDTAGPANHGFDQRSSSSQLQLGPQQQIAAPTDEKEAESKPKRVRIGPLKEQDA
jgi:hypothetical protein